MRIGIKLGFSKNKLLFFLFSNLKYITDVAFLSIDAHSGDIYDPSN